MWPEENDPAEACHVVLSLMVLFALGGQVAMRASRRVAGGVDEAYRGGEPEKGIA